MKGNISLSDFIHQVKKELIDAQHKSGDPFYRLTEVKLEVSFTLNATGKAGFDLCVVELNGETKAEQVHKVQLTLLPLAEAIAKDSKSTTDTHPKTAETSATRPVSAGGGGGMDRVANRIEYDRIRHDPNGGL